MDVIRILNFNEYNPRKDRKKHSWFRVENNIIFSPKLEGLNESQKWLWVGIVALANGQQRDWTELDVPYFVKHCGGTPETVRAAIDHFKNKDMIEIISKDAAKVSGNQSVPDGNRAESVGVPTDGRTNERTNERTDLQPLSKFLIHPDLQDETLPMLAEVPIIVQHSWLKEFPDKKWVLNALRKCVVKRTARGIPKGKDSWGAIFTNWLYAEKDPPKRRNLSSVRNEEPEAPDPRGKVLDHVLDKEAYERLKGILGNG